MKLMRVTAVDYTTEKSSGEELPIIQLSGRDEDGERRTLLVEDTIPYIYAREEEAYKVEDEDVVREVRDGYKGIKPEESRKVPVCRIDMQIPDNKSDLEKNFSETWEADIPFYRRACIDYGLSGHIRVPEQDRCSIEDIETDVEVPADDYIDPKIFIADIEVIQQNSETFDEMVEKNCDPISHIGIWDSHEDEYIILHLDPEDEVSPGEVSSQLEEHIEAESMLKEKAKDIHLRSFESEEELLRAFISLTENRRPDLYSGWNWVDFDWSYLLGRFEEVDLGNKSEHDLSDIGFINGYQTSRKVDCLPAFDMLDAYKKMTIPIQGKKRSWSLDYVAKEEISAGKLPNVSVSKTYREDKNMLLAYNIIDVMLCVALEDKMGIHEFFFELAELSQVQIYDTYSGMRLVDGYIMSRADDDEILPSAEEKDIPENAGGLVLNPSSGVNEWVGVLDLKSLYPSAIITWNISPETIHWYDDDPTPSAQHINIPWLPDADHAEGGEFDHDEIDFDVMWSDLSEEGLVPKYLKRLFPERAEKKAKRSQYSPDETEYKVWDNKQNAVKVLMNTFYGVSSMDYWRLGMHGLGDAITSAARYALWKGKEISQDEGYEVYYGDTDSVMLSLADPGEGMQAALDRGHDLEEVINSRMFECVEASGLMGPHPHITEELHGTDQHALSYEFEKLYRRFFQAGSKKRYAGNIVWKEGKETEDMDMVGFESQRSDSPELTEEVQPEVVNRILAGEGFEEVSEYVRGLIEDIKEREMELYKVALPSSLGQPLEDYGNTQASRACRYSNQHLDYEWSMGDDPWIYFIRQTPPMTPATDVLALSWDEDLPEGFEMDLDKTLDRALEGPLAPILREVGWRFTELKQGAQTGSAADGDWSGDWESDDDEEEDDEGWGW